MWYAFLVIAFDPVPDIGCSRESGHHFPQQKDKEEGKR
jgi:hypothetical protein